MHLVALLAGVVDPKFRLTALDAPNLPRKLSPFDEAALECALQLRDATPEATLTAVLLGGAEQDALLRAVMALRPQRTFRLEAALPWDMTAALALLRAALAAAGPAELVLMGREFGDGDDGVLPAALAECLGWAFCGQAHALTLHEGRLSAQRSRGPREEVLRLPLPALVSLTNARSNRLRHPLMKNVVLAKRAAPEVLAAPPLPEAMLHLREQRLAPPARRTGGGRVLHGPLEDQVAALAAALRGGAA